MKKWKKKEFEDIDYNGFYNVIIDISEVEIKLTPFSENEILKYIEHLEKEKIILNHKTSVVTITPYQFLHAEVFKIHNIKLAN